MHCVVLVRAHFARRSLQARTKKDAATANDEQRTQDGGAAVLGRGTRTRRTTMSTLVSFDKQVDISLMEGKALYCPAC